VVATLGAGGMGVVYRARDPRLGRDVAIKLLAPAATPNERPLLDTHATVDLRDAPPRGDDLLAEARAMARLSHPNVLPIYEVGVDGAALFLVMEYVAGTSLRGWLGAPRSTAEVRAMFAQAARGLAAAHAVGIVHRDFKPDNVLIGDDGRARVADFGLANVVAAPRAIEALAAVAGTPRYMAPELVRGAAADARSDVFALCRSIADALDGRDDVPAPLRAVVDTGLAEEPAARPPLAAVLAALDAAPARRTLPIVAAVAAAAAIGIGAFALTRGDAGAAGDCDATAAALLPGRWDDIDRALLRARLPEADAGWTIDQLDARAHAIVRLDAEACRDAAAGKLPADDAAHRRACLARSAIEVGADVRRALFHPAWSPYRVETVALQGGSPAPCRELVEPPLRDAAATTALTRRLIDSDDVPAAQQVDTLAALARDATAAGELELATRAELALAKWQRVGDHLADADATAERAYRDAVAIQSAQLTAQALIERGENADRRGDAAASADDARLALAVADKPTVPARTRAQIHLALAGAAAGRGDFAAALAATQQGEREHRDAGELDPYLDSQLSAMQVEALIGLDRAADAVAVAREDLPRIVHGFDPRDPEASVAHGTLADALSATHAYDEAIAERRAAIALLDGALGAGNSHALDARVRLAGDLEAAGRRDDGIAELQQVVDAPGDVPAPTHADALAALGEMRADAGELDVAAALLDRAIDELVAARGADSGDVRSTRLRASWVAIERDRPDDAARELAALDASVRRGGATAVDRGFVALRGAQLAALRGRFADAEVAARDAVARFGSADEAILARGALADALAGEQRWADARAAIAGVVDRAQGADVDAGTRGMLDAIAAAVALGAGDRATAIELARAALDAFATDHGYPREAARAARIAHVAAP
jgi:hypothetical protein